MIDDSVVIVGDRVRHLDAGLTGTVDSVTPEWVRVNWDHLALAYTALGQMCDYRKRDELETTVVPGGEGTDVWQ